MDKVNRSLDTGRRPNDPRSDTPPVLVLAAVQPEGRQLLRLQDILAGYLGRPVVVQVQVDPSIIGGLVIRVGDTVIDGSLRGRIETLRHHLRAQARIGGPQWAAERPPAPAAVPQPPAGSEGNSDAA
jgi:F-type H+-transporting ATPase subunit delta